MGLVPYINNYPLVQEFVRKLWTLSYIPENDVIMVWEKYILPSKPVYNAVNNDGDMEEDNNVR